jgi:hypothetical protein
MTLKSKQSVRALHIITESKTDDNFQLSNVFYTRHKLKVNPLFFNNSMNVIRMTSQLVLPIDHDYVSKLNRSTFDKHAWTYEDHVKMVEEWHRMKLI